MMFASRTCYRDVLLQALLFELGGSRALAGLLIAWRAGVCCLPTRLGRRRASKPAYCEFCCDLVLAAVLESPLYVARVARTAHCSMPWHPGQADRNPWAL